MCSDVCVCERERERERASVCVCVVLAVFVALPWLRRGGASAPARRHTGAVLRLWCVLGALYDHVVRALSALAHARTHTHM